MRRRPHNAAVLQFTFTNSMSAGSPHSSRRSVTLLDANSVIGHEVVTDWAVRISSTIVSQFSQSFHFRYLEFLVIKNKVGSDWGDGEQGGSILKFLITTCCQGILGHYKPCKTWKGFCNIKKWVRGGCEMCPLIKPKIKISQNKACCISKWPH